MTRLAKPGRSQISAIPRKDGTRPKSAIQSDAVRRGNRTRRLNKANAPFERLDGEAAEIVRRMDLDEGEEDHLDRNVGRVMLQGLALRKDLELAKDRRTEITMKLDEVDVRSEFEDLKRELGIS
jgi:hypothetical protein